MIERAPTARRIVCDGERLFRPLQARWPQLEALDNGESQHAAVAAASIVAKVRRDELWGKICRRYAPEFGDELVGAGGGYCNAGTRAFLRAYIKRYKRLPPEGRRSWPWDFARDLLGKRFDPWWDVPDDRPQLSLSLDATINTPASSPSCSSSPEATPARGASAGARRCCCGADSVAAAGARSAGAFLAFFGSGLRRASVSSLSASWICALVTRFSVLSSSSRCCASCSRPLCVKQRTQLTRSVGERYCLAFSSSA